TAVETAPPAPKAEAPRQEQPPQQQQQPRPQHQNQQHHQQRPQHQPQRPQGGAQGTEDVSSIDAETNARYEQVKGGKLYIKDLQQMDHHALQEIARNENIQDY